MSEREALLKKIQICDFALVELNEYLDTHPDCQYALASYREHLCLSNELRQKYNNMYGPITARDFDCDRTWAWVENPWPWQNECDSDNNCECKCRRDK